MVDEFSFITVAIIAYNAEKTIEKCLRSIITQEYPKQKYEVVIVDDASTDKTLEAISKFPVSKVIKLKKRVTRGEARNICLREAKGEIVAMPDADEVLPPNYLKELAKCFEDPAVAYVWGARRHILGPQEEMGLINKAFFRFFRS